MQLSKGCLREKAKSLRGIIKREWMSSKFSKINFLLKDHNIIYLFLSEHAKNYTSLLTYAVNSYMAADSKDMSAISGQKISRNVENCNTVAGDGVEQLNNKRKMFVCSLNPGNYTPTYCAHNSSKCL